MSNLWQYGEPAGIPSNGRMMVNAARLGHHEGSSIPKEIRTYSYYQMVQYTFARETTAHELIDTNGRTYWLICRHVSKAHAPRVKASAKPKYSFKVVNGRCIEVTEPRRERNTEQRRVSKPTAAQPSANTLHEMAEADCNISQQELVKAAYTKSSVLHERLK